MKKSNHAAIAVLVVFFVSAALFSCRRSEEIAEEIAAPPPADELVPVVATPVQPPVAREPMPPDEWADRYGPAGAGEIVAIGDLYAARRIDHPGTAGNFALSWDEAMDYVLRLDWLGKTDWRLPTDEELAGIYSSADLLEGFEESGYWTSSLHPRVPDEKAVIFDFNTGRVHYRDRPEPAFIRAVRSKE